MLATALIAGTIGGAVGHSVGTTTVLAQTTPAAGSQINVGVAATIEQASVAAAQGAGAAVVSVRTDQGLGSGVIYDASGLILTNAHVVSGARTITVGLIDGRHFTGRSLGADTGFDLAVVKIDGSNLPTATLGSSSNLQVGEFVMAIGNPYGFDHTVTTGVVSALNRPVSEGQGSYNQPMIQTDAAINPGNSGGPLFDLQGNVVGITTLIAAPNGVPAQGLGFAVPIDTAKRIAPQLAQNGTVTRSGQPYLGVSLSDVPSQGSSSSSQGGARRRTQPATPLGVDHGAVVSQLGANSPAAQGGVQSGDIVTSFNGRDVYSSDELLQGLVQHAPGDRVQLGVVRGGQTMNVTVTLGEAPVAS
jgi:S1-C subfamily serine protease